MDRREAIRILMYPVYKWSLDWDKRSDGLSYCDAIQMAINALCAQKEIQEIVEQLELCGYECEGGPLEMNDAFVRLKEIACGRKLGGGDTDGRSNGES